MRPELVDWPAPERNKDPILAVLRRVLPSSGLVLEVASGTGQHIAHFAEKLPGLVFQPSDVSDEHLGQLEARTQHAQLPNLLRPVRLDVSARPWSVGACAAVYCANMMHIAPWQATLDLFKGAAEVLSVGSPLVTYGPYANRGEHVSESNAEFDRSLRARHPDWGVRDIAELEPVAAASGLLLEEQVVMPANNFTLIWRRVSLD
jgi:SAM-dependent methyltransferase